MHGDGYVLAPGKQVVELGHRIGRSRDVDGDALVFQELARRIGNPHQPKRARAYNHDAGVSAGERNQVLRSHAMPCYPPPRFHPVPVDHDVGTVLLPVHFDVSKTVVGEHGIWPSSTLRACLAQLLTHYCILRERGVSFDGSNRMAEVHAAMRETTLMNKKEVAAALEEIAVLLELSGENPFKARSYFNVARALEQLEEDIETVVREKRLRAIKGIGEALEKKIEEFVTTGSLKYLEDLRAKFPETLFELFAIPSLGAKRIKTLYEELGVQSLGELEYACTENRLLALKGFGEKMQQKLLEGIAFAKKHRDLHLFDAAFAEAQRLRDILAKDPAVIRIEIAGSLRRRKEVIKDIDILVSAKQSQSIMKRFVEAEGVEQVTACGDTKSSVILAAGIAADVRVVTDAQFPYALHHFTGSKEHNVAMRQRAREMGLKMNEYGLFRGEKNVPCKDETELFAALGLPLIPPELREDMGELSLTVEALPRLVEREDLIGLFHCHSTYSDGAATIAQMAEAARERGYRYLALADHSQSAGYAGGLSPAAVEKQHQEIDALNKRLKGFRLLKGIESDIRTNGSLDYDEATLARFDLVIASVHSKLGMTEEEATRRIVRAVENPFTTILGHPTGRLLLAREGYPLDFNRVFNACAAHGVAIEINANCHRLDLDWRQCKRAKEKGIKLCIAPDAHNIEGMDDVVYGLGIARKGWLDAGDVLNSMTAEEFLGWRKSR